VQAVRARKPCVLEYTFCVRQVVERDRFLLMGKASKQGQLLTEAGIPTSSVFLDSSEWLMQLA